MHKAVRRERVRPYRRFQFLVKLLRAARQVQGEHSRRRVPPLPGMGERTRTRIRTRTRTCMMHMDRAPEVAEAAKELSSRRNDFVTVLHRKISPTYSIETDSHCNQRFVSVTWMLIFLINSQSVCPLGATINLCNWVTNYGWGICTNFVRHINYWIVCYTAWLWKKISMLQFQFRSYHVKLHFACFICLFIYECDK